jgi:hypothetical protein
VESPRAHIALTPTDFESVTVRRYFRFNALFGHIVTATATETAIRKVTLWHLFRRQMLLDTVTHCLIDVSSKLRNP